jgi:hypothetical protein
VLRPTSLLLLVLALAGCDASRRVTVEVSIPDLDGAPTPASGVTITALPFDRESLATALEHQHGVPRPHTAELDSLYDIFRDPFLAYFRAGRIRDAVADSVARHQLPASSLAAADARAAAARDSLARVRAVVGARIDSLRADVGRWEDSTYRGYDTLARHLVSASGGRVLTDTTDANGVATLELPPVRGGWWISASSWDPLDPNRMWYWNVPATSDTVRLTPESGRRRSRGR